tara:strand:+ start:91 stop:381 length:291 start_codon:yes stop_codon:yes gene_type:complete
MNAKDLIDQVVDGKSLDDLVEGSGAKKAIAFLHTIEDVQVKLLIAVRSAKGVIPPNDIRNLSKATAELSSVIQQIGGDIRHDDKEDMMVSQARYGD